MCLLHTHTHTHKHIQKYININIYIDKTLASRDGPPTRKTVYQLLPKVCASCVSYRHTTKRLNFAPSGETGKRTRRATRDTARARTHTHTHTHTNIDTPPSVQPLLLSTTWKGPTPPTLVTDDDRRDSRAADGHRTKVPWTGFDSRTVLFFLNSLVDNCCTWKRTAGPN
jgi:hypothetical protein